MEIIMGKYAGYCHGVAKALAAIKINADKKLSTYGAIVNNKQVTRSLEERGVSIIEDIDSALEEDTVVIRSHGVSPSVYEGLEARGIGYIDATCPDVKKVHDIVRKARHDGNSVIIVGNADHPEIIGIFGHAGGEASEAGRDVVLIPSMAEAESFVAEEGKAYSLVVQTTYSTTKFAAISEKLAEKIPGLIVNDTICPTTYRRQAEAESLSKTCEIMIVVGDKTSSNTNKLYEICSKNCKTYLIETKDDLQLNIFAGCGRVGVVAGASTPPDTIKEAVSLMISLDSNGQSTFENNNASEQGAIDPNTQNKASLEAQEPSDSQEFQKMLDDSFVALHMGDIVKGIVISVVNGEVNVNLGYKSDGLITRGEFSSSSEDPAEVLKPGDEIEVYVMRVNDGDGNVLLSKKKLDAYKHFNELEQAFEEKRIITGKVHDVVKGGIIVFVNGVRVFVPSSQVANRFVSNEAMAKLVGKELNLEILEFDRGRRRVVGGRRELATREEAEVRQRVFDSLEVGAHVDGTVSRIASFGAFVDLGGVDGLIHISQLAWGRVKRVTDVLSEGDKVRVAVIDADREKGKISLSLKHLGEDPWNAVDVKYYVGQVVSGKVVRLAPFGAFVELEDGVDGLVHVSQISRKHVERPEDALSVGDVIDVKIINIDMVNNKISLSKKDADPQEADDENNEDYRQYLGTDVGPQELPNQAEGHYTEPLEP